MTLATVLRRFWPALASLLVLAYPSRGLDIATVRSGLDLVRTRCEAGAGVLMISEDLDELLELSDRIAVMSEGRIVFETPAAGADRRVIGAHMGGGHHDPLPEAA